MIEARRCDGEAAAAAEVLHAYTPTLTPRLQYRIPPPTKHHDSGHYIPGGVRISASPAIVHRNPDAFLELGRWVLLLGRTWRSSRKCAGTSGCSMKKRACALRRALARFVRFFSLHPDPACRLCGGYPRAKGSELTKCSNEVGTSDRIREERDAFSRRRGQKYELQKVPHGAKLVLRFV